MTVVFPRFCLLLFLFGLLGLPFGFAQNAYWLYLKDKGANAEIRLRQPRQFLSQAAIDRRIVAGIGLNETDLPVETAYLSQIRDAECEIAYASRWLNAVAVRSTLSPDELIARLPFVARCEPVRLMAAQMATVDTANYGVTFDQIDQIGLTQLNEQGFNGQGVKVAVFDAGFINLDSLPAFHHLRQRGGLKAYYDFVQNDTTVFDAFNHGLEVSSVIAAYTPTVYRGGAKDVDLYLAKTENDESETPVEELNWLRAAEWADSIGVDIISSSLSYTLFDNGVGDHTYAQMDGNTTVVTRAADWAASKGILVVNSAGNEGAKPWRKICAPCDGDSVLCVGAVNADGAITVFSSVGPSADKRIKPDVVARGEAAAVIQPDGAIGYSSGTSFSCPLVTSLAACLKSKYPAATNMELIEAIRRSADRHANPDTIYGHGLPNATRAVQALETLQTDANFLSNNNLKLRLSPNPASTNTRVLWTQPDFKGYRLRMTDALGRVVYEKNDCLANIEINIDLADFPNGLYYLSAHSDEQTLSSALNIQR